MPDAARDAIDVRRLTKRFGDLVAVDAVSFSVAAKEIFGLLGSNGAGKSTLIKMLTTLLPPTDGDAYVARASVRRAPAAVRRRIGYVPQLLSADGALTGRENLLLSARMYGVPAAQRRPRIDDALQFMTLADAASRLVRTYSGGMIRRLELAQAMLHRPEVLFLDEPTIGLDPIARHAVWDRLRSLRDDIGMTVLLTTHDMEEAAALCEQLAILHRGRLMVTGQPGALRAALGPDATLDDVFAHHCGGTIDDGGGFAGVRAARATARRLG